MLNRLIAVCLILILACSIACNDPRHPGFEYMPDMYHSRAYETYDPNPNVEDTSGAIPPAKGTIPRGHKIYHYENTNADYERAGRELVNPILYTTEVKAEASRLYKIYCAICHGPTGTGNGTIVERGVFPPPPEYSVRLEGMPDGKIFHSITYGKNLMGPYKAQLTYDERWMLVHFIKELAFSEDGKENMNVSADTSISIHSEDQ